MAITTPYYRLYFREFVRKYLNLNYKNRQIFIFKIKDDTYLSTDTIPKDITKVKFLKAGIGKGQMFVNIPTHFLDYEPKDFKIVHMQGKVIKIEKE